MIRDQTREFRLLLVIAERSLSGQNFNHDNGEADWVS